MNSYSARMVFRIIALFLIISGFGLRNCWSLPDVNAAGFVSEEGEYLPDPLMNGSVPVKVSYVMSQTNNGGSVIFTMPSINIRYQIDKYLGLWTPSLELWTSFLGHWHCSTWLPVPEEMRLATGLMIEPDIDIGWIQTICDDISKKQGYDQVYSIPWEIRDEHTAINTSEGGGSSFDNVGDTQGGTPLSATQIPEKVSSRRGKSYLFEKLVNRLAVLGYFYSTLGIPKGVDEVDLQYRRIFLFNGMKRPVDGCGIDGFFFGKAVPGGECEEGKRGGDCYLIETKFSEQGQLGRTILQHEPKDEPVDDDEKTVTIYQASPQWICKVIYNMYDESRNNEIKKMEYLNAKYELNGTGMDKLMDMVETIYNEEEQFADKYKFSEEYVRNFADVQKVIDYIALDSTKRQLIQEVGDFIENSIWVGVVNKQGGKIKYFDEMKSEWVLWCLAFGRKAELLDKRIRFTGYEKIF